MKMDEWLLLISIIVGGGGIVGFAAAFIRVGKNAQRLNTLEDAAKAAKEDIDNIQEKISNGNMTVAELKQAIMQAGKDITFFYEFLMNKKP